MIEDGEADDGFANPSSCRIEGAGLVETPSPACAHIHICIYIHRIYTNATIATSRSWMHGTPAQRRLPLPAVWHVGLQLVEGLFKLACGHVVARLGAREQLGAHLLLVLYLGRGPLLPLLKALVFEPQADLERALAEVGADVEGFFLGYALADGGQVSVVVGIRGAPCRRRGLWGGSGAS